MRALGCNVRVGLVATSRSFARDERHQSTLGIVHQPRSIPRGADFDIGARKHDAFSFSTRYLGAITRPRGIGGVRNATGFAADFGRAAYGLAVRRDERRRRDRGLPRLAR